MKKLLRKLFLCSVVLFSGLNLMAQDEAGDEAPKAEVSAVEEAEITGVVSKKEGGAGVSYTLKAITGAVLALPAKNGEVEIDYAPFVGKSVVVKGKAEVKVKTDDEGNETRTVVSIKSLESIEEVEAE